LREPGIGVGESFEPGGVCSPSAELASVLGFDGDADSDGFSEIGIIRQGG
jgi:hypothetical protein